MKMIVAAALLALSFTTGFTCSKNTPATVTPTPEAAAPAAPEAAAPAAPEAAPADATATPAEGQPTQ